MAPFQCGEFIAIVGNVGAAHFTAGRLEAAAFCRTVPLCHRHKSTSPVAARPSPTLSANAGTLKLFRAPAKNYPAFLLCSMFRFIHNCRQRSNAQLKYLYAYLRACLSCKNLSPFF